MKVTVKTLDSTDHSFPVAENITVKEFKEFISSTVRIPPDKQRLIYCGRVLQDDKKLAEYDVDEKVIHLVARAPPQAQNRSSSADSRVPTRASRPSRPSGSSFLLRPHQNVVLGPVIVPQDGENLTAGSSSSGVRLRQAQTMLEQASAVLDAIEQRFNPELSSSSSGSNASNAETSSASQLPTSLSQTTHPRHPPAEVMSRIQNSEVDAIFTEIDSLHTMEPQMGAMMGHPLLGASPILAGGLAQAASAAVVSALSSLDGAQLRQGPGGLGNVVNLRATREQSSGQSNNATPSTSTSQQSSSSEPQSAGNANSTTEAPRAPRLTREHPRCSVMAAILQQHRAVQRRLEPYMERYYQIMASESTYPSSSSPELMVDQWLISKVSEVMHFLSHALHGMSDIIIDLRREPPRELRARPIIVPQPSLIQAQINVSATEASPRSTPETTPTRTSTPSTTRAQRSASASRASSERRGRAGAPNTSEPSGINMRHFLSSDDGMVMMHWGSSDNVDSPSALQNLLSSITSEVTMQFGPEQMDTGTPSSSSSASTNGNVRGNASPGQNTQAPGNSATSTTNATHTRVTPVPHMQVTPFNVSGMAMNQFDPFLHCSSHHLPSRRRHNASVQYIRRLPRMTQVRQEVPRTPTATRPPASQSNSTRATPETEDRNLLQEMLTVLGIDGDSELTSIIQGPLSLLVSEPDGDSTLLERLCSWMIRSLQRPSLEQLQQAFAAHRLPGETVSAQIRRGVCELIPFIENYLLEPAESMSNDVFSAPNSFFNFFNQRLTQLFNIMATHREPFLLSLRVLEYLINMWKDYVAIGYRCLRDSSRAIEQLTSAHITTCLTIVPELSNLGIGRMIRERVSESLRDTSMVEGRDVDRYLIQHSNSEIATARREMNAEASSRQATGTSATASADPEAMEVDEDTTVPMETPAPAETPIEINVGAQSWHSAVPEEWIPVITRDVARQRRSVPDSSPSDGYLCGMPYKRRRIACQHKPHGTVEDVLQSTLRTSLRSAGIPAQVLERVSSNPSEDLRESFAAQIRSSLSENLRDNKDFTPEKFPKSDQKIRKK